MRGSSAWLCCPFHRERTPSCSVNLATNKKVPVGHFYCFGCSAKGNWNKFAEKIGARLIDKEDEGKLYETGVHSDKHSLLEQDDSL